MKSKKVLVHKFSSFAEAELAEIEYYKNLSVQERVRIFTQLVGHKDPKDGIVERSVRIYTISKQSEG